MDETIVVNGVTYYRQKPADAVNEELREKYEWIKTEASQMLSRAQELYDQMKNDGLTIGLIESEGYLRAAKDMQKWVDYVEKWSE